MCAVGWEWKYSKGWGLDSNGDPICCGGTGTRIRSGTQHIKNGYFDMESLGDRISGATELEVSGSGVGLEFQKWCYDCNIGFVQELSYVSPMFLLCFSYLLLFVY